MTKSLSLEQKIKIEKSVFEIFQKGEIKQRAKTIHQLAQMTLNRSIFQLTESEKKQINLLFSFSKRVKNLEGRADCQAALMKLIKKTSPTDLKAALNFSIETLVWHSEAKLSPCKRRRIFIIKDFADSL